MNINLINNNLKIIIMKKILSLVSILLLGGSLMAQTIVSTTPTNRNAILEEYTGVNCGYCPDGHRIANQLAATYYGHFFAINIHQGGYAARYKTQWGNALANQTGLQGYPSGTINRHVFSGSSTALGRNNWASCASQIMSQQSPVNVAAVLTTDDATRELSLHIEVYYTANSNVSTNLLNVALLQNNVLGPQSGAENFNPEYWDGTNYRHMHMLRELLTGQWGVEIPATQGTFIDTTITYTVPATMGTGTDNVAIPTLDDLEVVVFITESHQEIITGTKAIRVTDVPELVNFSADNDDCSLEYKPYVTIANYTENDLSDFVVNYNGQSLTLAKTIGSLMVDTIHLPAVVAEMGTATVNPVNVTCTATLTGYSDAITGESSTITGGATFTRTFADFTALNNITGPITVDLALDHYGSETYLFLYDQSNCSEVWHKYGFTDQSAQTLLPARHYKYILSPANAGTYIFYVYDSYGDGMTYASDDSGFKLYDGNNNLLVNNDGNFGSVAEYWINIVNAGSGTFVGIDDVTPVINFSLYPNPATDRLTINTSEAIREVSVIDVTGRTLMSGVKDNSIDVSGLATGVYMVRIATESGVGIQKFVKE